MMSSLATLAGGCGCSVVRTADMTNACKGGERRGDRGDDEGEDDSLSGKAGALGHRWNRESNVRVYT